MRYYLRADIGFACVDPERDTEDGFDAFTDVVMDELGDLEEVDPGLIDPDLTATLTERSATVLMGVEADSHNDAVRLFLANVRTALHAAGCGTPNRPGFKPTTQRPTVREAEHTGA